MSNGMPPHDKERQEIEELVRYAIQDDIRGQSPFPTAQRDAEVVARVAGAEALSTADLEKIAASMNATTLADARLEKAREDMVHAMTETYGALKPTPAPGQAGESRDERTPD
jgi:hypothetical protein